jgi:hypothetical protein
MDTPRTHLVIPDTQAKAGVPTDHLYWIGEYIVDRKPDVVVHLGDHWDMPSLSSYDVGKRQFEGRRYLQDIESGNAAFSILNESMTTYNEPKKKWRKGVYEPELHLLLGNHEDRITRAVDGDAKLEGTIGLQDLNASEWGWQVHPFLKPVDIDGVWYAHYWANPMNGRAMGGQALSRLKNIGHSFTMGHQQTLDYAVRFVGAGDSAKSQHGLVAGAAYLHDEDYKGFQGNAHWRGVIVCHEVSEGSYDPMFVSMNYLCKKYEGVPLSKYTAKRF